MSAPRNLVNNEIEVIGLSGEVVNILNSELPVVLDFEFISPGAVTFGRQDPQNPQYAMFNVQSMVNTTDNYNNLIPFRFSVSDMTGYFFTAAQNPTFESVNRQKLGLANAGGSLDLPRLARMLSANVAREGLANTVIGQHAFSARTMHNIFSTQDVTTKWDSDFLSTPIRGGVRVTAADTLTAIVGYQRDQAPASDIIFVGYTMTFSVLPNNQVQSRPDGVTPTEWRDGHPNAMILANGDVRVPFYGA